jgi:hypothetical protein
MGAQVLTFDEIKGRTFEDVIQDILAQDAIITVLLPDRKAVVISSPILSPVYQVSPNKTHRHKEKA